MKKFLAISIIFFFCNNLVYSEIPPIKVKDLVCSTLENNFRDRSRNDYWSIIKKDSFAEKTFLSADGFEVFVWNFDVKKNLDFIYFTRTDTYEPEAFKVEYILSRKKGTMNLFYLGSKTEFKCRPSKKKFNAYDFLESKAKENIKKKKSDIKF